MSCRNTRHIVSILNLIRQVAAAMQPFALSTVATCLCCNLVQTTSLEDPYGVCGTQTLNYYDWSVAYSAARCAMECDTKYFVQECLCKDVYMPGTRKPSCKRFCIQNNILNEVKRRNVCPPVCLRLLFTEINKSNNSRNSSNYLLYQVDELKFTRCVFRRKERCEVYKQCG